MKLGANHPKGTVRVGRGDRRHRPQARLPERAHGDLHSRACRERATGGVSAPLRRPGTRAARPRSRAVRPFAAPHDPALVHHQDLVGSTAGKGDVLLDEQDGEARLLRLEDDVYWSMMTGARPSEGSLEDELGVRHQHARWRASAAGRRRAGSPCSPRAPRGWGRGRRRPSGPGFLSRLFLPEPLARHMVRFSRIVRDGKMRVPGDEADLSLIPMAVASRPPALKEMLPPHAARSARYRVYGRRLAGSVAAQAPYNCPRGTSKETPCRTWLVP